MEQTCRPNDAGIPAIAAVKLGKTRVGDQVNKDLLAYIVRSEAAIYVSMSSLERVAAKLKSEIRGQRLTIRKGKPFSGDRGFVLECDIKPLDALPADKPVAIGDGKVVDNHVCTLVEPLFCCHIFSEIGVFDFSFKAPSYGMSWCKVSPGELCESWLAEEHCDTFMGLLCMPPPPINRSISAWVCSMP